MISKAERLLNLMAMLLDATRPVTAREIHQTIPGYGHDDYNSFKRMFERDKEHLREMGIPLEMNPLDAWEEEEGYTIPKERYYLPPLQLDEEEAAALWLAAGLVRQQEPGTARSALMKLSEDIPVSGEEGHSWVSADLGLTAPALPRVYEGVSERRTLTFSYKGKKETKKRTVDPYGLVHRGGSWYLVGRDHSSDEPRSFRLDRIEGDVRFFDTRKSGPQFDVPEGFDPRSALDAPPFVQGERLGTAQVRFDPETAWWVERSTPWLQLEFESDGSATATTPVTDEQGFTSWVLGFGEGAEVLSPESLRDAIRSRLEEMCGRVP